MSRIREPACEEGVPIYHNVRVETGYFVSVTLSYGTFLETRPTMGWFTGHVIVIPSDDGYWQFPLHQ